jgi:hypothetical protein
MQAVEGILLGCDSLPGIISIPVGKDRRSANDGKPGVIAA